MDVQKKLDEIVAAVEGARSMPMSASCVLNRAELISLLGNVRSALPDSLSQAEALIGGREQVVAEAHAEAERIIATAHEERGSLISGTEIVQRSQAEADRILAEARREAEEIRAEADEYVDSKLANFEVVLTKTLGSVDRGREKLLGRGPGIDEHGEVDEEAPERSADPSELRRRADAYVDAKLGAFEAVLAKTLEAVGRGRQKLTGHSPTDELGEHLAAQDAAGAADHQTDSEYLAGLAGARDEPAVAAAYGDGGHQEQPAYDPGVMAVAAGYEQPGFEQAGYDQPAGYGYQHDAYQNGYQDGTYQEGGYPEYGAIPQQGGYPDPSGYGWQQGYDGLPHAEGLGQIPQQHQPQLEHQLQVTHYGQGQQPAGLDETSFFDTGLIDLDQLRELEQGR